MRDWEAFARRHLSLSHLSTAQEQRIVREIAALLREHYHEARADGKTPEEADQYARSQVSDWTELSRRIRKTRRSVRLALQLPIWKSGNGARRIDEFLRGAVRGLRILQREPVFSLAVVFSLALAIGANGAIFSVVDSIVLNPLPYPSSERLVVLDHEGPGAKIEWLGISRGVFFHYQELAQTIETASMYQQMQVALSGEGPPQQVWGAAVSPGFFELFLGGPLPVGQVFGDSSGRPGAPRVAIISDRLWRTRFAADPGIVGETLRVRGEPFRIVGVCPPGLNFPRAETDLWWPLQIDRAQVRLGQFSSRAVARIRPGFSAEDVQTELRELIPRLEETYPGPAFDMIVARGGLAPLVTGLKESVIGGVDDLLWLLLATAGLVFVMACANVANLFMARAEDRQPEMALRSALGAGRLRLLCDSFSESWALSWIAALLGLLLALWGVRALVLAAPVEIPRLHEVSISLSTVALTFGVMLAASLVLGLIPELWRRPRPLAESLKRIERGSSGRRIRGRQFLVVTQLALAVILLVGAGLMVRTFRQLRAVDPGFNASGLLTFHLTLPRADYPEEPRSARFQQEIITNLEALPGVVSAGAVDCLPLTNCRSLNPLYEADHPPEPGEIPPAVAIHAVAPGYFRTMKVPLLSGRVLMPSDHEQPTRAAVITKSLADQFWPGVDPIGKKVYPDLPPANVSWYSIVGVVGDIRLYDLTREASPQIYLPMVGPYVSPNSLFFVVRTLVPPSALFERVRRVVWEADGRLPVADLRTMTEITRDAEAPTRSAMTLMLVSGAVALVLGAVGVYGVLAFVVGRRSREIGVRMALGADRRAVIWMVMRQGAIAASVGMVAGVIGSLALTWVMSSLLFGVSPTDPLTYVSVAAVLLSATLLASYAPARQAARVDPVKALSAE